MKKRFHFVSRLMIHVLATALVVSNFSVSASAFTVSENSIWNGVREGQSFDDFDFIIPAQVYTGEEIRPIESIGNLTEGEDYTVTYTNNVSAGTASAYVETATGESYTYTFKILQKDISELSFSMADTFFFTGAEIIPEVTLTMDNGAVLTQDDYTVVCSDNVNIGTAELIVIPKNKSLTGTIKKTFSITECRLAQCTIAEIADIPYTGTAIKPALSIQTSEGKVLDASSYTVTYNNNISVGEASFTVVGKGNTYGTLTGSFQIVPADIATATVARIGDVTWDGNAKTPALTVKLGTTLLKAGTDYTATYLNNVNSGTATVTLTGINNLCGTTSATFTIGRAIFTKAKVTFEDEYTYTGKAIRPSVTVEGYQPGEYEVYYKNNINAGKATIQLRMGSQIVYKYFTIKPLDISKNISIRGLKNHTYSGKAKKQSSLKIKDVASKKLLVSGKDYSLSYKNNKNVGMATVIIKGKGNYAGEIVRSYVIKPGKAKISKVKRKGSRLTVTAKKMSGATGFEVQVSKTPDFKKTKSASYDGRKVTIKKCTKGITWYIRMRAYYEYETKDGSIRVYYGKWSKVRAIS